MKIKGLFYGLLMMFFAGSISLIEMENTKILDILNVNSLGNSNESRSEPPCEGCYEEEDLGELIAESELSF